VRFPRQLLLTICLFALGCGYAIEGAVSNLPSNIRGLAIPIAQNASSKTRLAVMLTDELNRQFTTSKFLKLEDIDRADAILKVSIRSVKIEGATLTNIARTSSRRMIVTVDASLKRKDTDTILWRSKGIVGRETYVVAADQVSTELNEELAMKKITRDLAEKIHNYIFEGF